jgi:hypothetical protein
MAFGAAVVLENLKLIDVYRGWLAVGDADQLWGLTP